MAKARPAEIPEAPVPVAVEAESSAGLPPALGPGGVPTGDVTILPLVLFVETAVRLKELADKRGCTVGELLQRAVDKYVAADEGT